MPTSRQWWTGAVAACAADVSTTWYGIEVLGAVEQNPLLATLMAEIGVMPTLVGAKVGVLAVAVMFYHVVDEHQWAIPAIPLVMYLVIAILNLIEIVFIA